MSNIKALLVGVCEYSALGLQELPLCKNDVFKELKIEIYGVKLL